MRADGKIRVFFGMVNGIQLAHGPRAGRIVLPGWALLNETGATGKYDVSASALMHSDGARCCCSCGAKHQHATATVSSFPSLRVATDKVMRLPLFARV